MEVLFYQPHNMFWNQTLEFQNLIKNSNQNINVLTCNGVLKNHCMVFNAKKLAINGDNLKKKNICEECISNKKIYKRFNKIKDHEKLPTKIYLSQMEFNNI